MSDAIICGVTDAAAKFLSEYGLKVPSESDPITGKVSKFTVYTEPVSEEERIDGELVHPGLVRFIIKRDQFESPRRIREIVQHIHRRDQLPSLIFLHLYDEDSGEKLFEWTPEELEDFISSW